MGVTIYAGHRHANNTNPTFKTSKIISNDCYVNFMCSACIYIYTPHNKHELITIRLYTGL